MQISVSILNTKDRNNSTLLLNNTDTDYIHIDVMDGKFVSNTNFTIEEIRQISLLSKKKLDIHLMVQDPLIYINKLKDLKNIAYITIHAELEKDILSILNIIKSSHIGCGLALNPGTSIEKVVPYYDKMDLLLLMSVMPGKGGQEFIDITSKIKEITANENYSFKIEVDGGINPSNIEKLRDSKVDIAVVGSYITSKEDYQIPLNHLRNAILNEKKK